MQPEKPSASLPPFVMLVKELTLKQELTAERLRELLHYNPETGQFVRKASLRSDRVGAIAYSLHTNGYSRFSLDNKNYYAHRLAWLYVYGSWPSGDIDHINHEKTDNRISNLRDVSRSVNNQNRVRCKSESASGVLGVSWHKAAQKWSARISLNGKSQHLGLFAEKDNAKMAYIDAKRALHEGCTI